MIYLFKKFLRITIINRTIIYLAALILLPQPSLHKFSKTGSIGSICVGLFFKGRKFEFVVG